MAFGDYFNGPKHKQRVQDLEALTFPPEIVPPIKRVFLLN